MTALLKTQQASTALLNKCKIILILLQIQFLRESYKIGKPDKGKVMSDNDHMTNTFFTPA